MKTNNMLKNLTAWIDDLKEAATDDYVFSVAWFPDTQEFPISIVGGWMEGFSENYSDLCLVSKSEPKYAMCVKICLNEGPYAYADFETLLMPTDKSGNVDDTCIVLEQEDDSEGLAAFLLCEWERIMTEHGGF